MIYFQDDDYWFRQRYDDVMLVKISTMTSPVRCTRCNHVYDLGAITEYGRYQDCTTWRCPGCRIGVSDRPHSWGYDHHYVKLDKDGQEKR